MNKNVWVGFVVVYILLTATNFLIHGMLLKSTYEMPEVAALMRTPETAKLGIHFITAAIVAFFVTLVFSKGYEGKGLAEGVRFGFYVGLLMSVPMAYDMYAEYPIPYHLALLWFIYGLLQYIVVGIALAMVFGSKKPAAAV
jgi:hypothetical protein